jgi:hypothetical protein
MAQAKISTARSQNRSKGRRWIGSQSPLRGRQDGKSKAQVREAVKSVGNGREGVEEQSRKRQSDDKDGRRSRSSPSTEEDYDKISGRRGTKPPKKSDSRVNSNFHDGKPTPHGDGRSRDGKAGSGSNAFGSPLHPSWELRLI